MSAIINTASTAVNRVSTIVDKLAFSKMLKTGLTTVCGWGIVNVVDGAATARISAIARDRPHPRDFGYSDLSYLCDEYTYGGDSSPATNNS